MWKCRKCQKETERTRVVGKVTVPLCDDCYAAVKQNARQDTINREWHITEIRAACDARVRVSHAAMFRKHGNP